MTAAAGIDASAAAMLAAQWVHTVAAALWLGGGVVYLLAGRAASRRAQPVAGAFAADFRGLVDAAVVALVVSGVVLAFERLTASEATGVYGTVLGVKVALTLWMFWLAGVVHRRRPGARRPGAPRSTQSTPSTTPKPRRRLPDAAHQVVGIGVAVFGLSTLLQLLFERALR